MQFLPADENFCLITFTLLPSPLLNATSLEKRNAAVWTYDTPRPLGNGANGATTFVAPRLDRPKSWYDKLGNSSLDVTDHLYIGARPGHNKQAESLSSLLAHGTPLTVPGSSGHRPSGWQGQDAHLPTTQQFPHLCDVTGHDGTFRSVWLRAQPGRVLRREDGLVRARRGGLLAAATAAAAALAALAAAAAAAASNHLRVL
eukprot:scaffold28935_cov58-Phaeocystis_antarctica.AAC.1